MRVCPPTRMTSSISEGCISASARACRQGPSDRWTRSSVICSSFARVSVKLRCFGPLASLVIKGRLISACCALESSHFAVSAASLRRCSDIGSLRRSIPWLLRNSCAIQSITAWSKSSPPRCVSPFVLFTSKTPSPISRIEMSNVPPPRS